MADTGRSGDVAMADFRLGHGAVTVWADIDCMRDAQIGTNKTLLLNLAHAARASTAEYEHDHE